MKKREKGFTLIELLVVVAIIGALAAVGVVAYNGYTAAAKKNAAKSIHSGAVKYIAAEMAKCVVDDSDTILGSVACPGTGGSIADAYVGLSQDKNPWSTSTDAASKVASKPDTVAKGNLYLIVTEDAPNDIEILMSDGDSEFTTTLSVE
tara:strand:+ start:549 stop:995 length:447 start_codon:yes stop_codon:yes gene_type:complete